ncbi:hypothetical protein H1C71_040588 [Ictidomys tridecemlineatus]|nr:hypothetical protein H1C71_040588 [Ictidomys tridecemlineatus]
MIQERWREMPQRCRLSALVPRPQLHQPGHLLPAVASDTPTKGPKQQVRAIKDGTFNTVSQIPEYLGSSLLGEVPRRLDCGDPLPAKEISQRADGEGENWNTTLRKSLPDSHVNYELSTSPLIQGPTE